MIKVAFIKSNGEVASVVTPADDNMYVDGQIYGHLQARHISVNENSDTVMQTWYWDKLSNSWGERPKRMEFTKWSEEQTWEADIQLTWETIRRDRDMRLGLSDWTQFTDTPLTPEQKSAWAAYRQELRNIPETYSSATHPNDVVWPTKPE
jgi:hypothetical protein